MVGGVAHGTKTEWLAWQARAYVLRGRTSQKFKPSVERYDEEKAAQCKKEPIEIECQTERFYTDK
jgi:hypothetical protein